MKRFLLLAAALTAGMLLAGSGWFDRPADSQVQEAAPVPVHEVACDPESPPTILLCDFDPHDPNRQA